MHVCIRHPLLPNFHLTLLSSLKDLASSNPFSEQGERLGFEEERCKSNFSSYILYLLLLLINHQPFSFHISCLPIEGEKTPL